MSVPNHFFIVHQVFDRGGWNLTTHEGSGQFTEACTVALHAVDRRWGYLKKNPGQNQYNGHSVDGSLYLSDTPGQSTHVDYIAASESPSAHIAWTVDTPRYSPSDWYAPAGVPAPVVKCRLGVSLFWLLAGLKFFPDQLQRNVAWIRDTLKVDYVRAIVCVGGDTFVAPDGQRYDPWAHMGAWLDWPDHGQLIGLATDALFDQGIKVQWTLIGGLSQIPTMNLQHGLVQHFLNHVQGRHSKLELVEVMNEYIVNGGSVSMLRELVRRLRAGLPDSVPISLSSPHSTHNGGNIPAEVRIMYEGLPQANAITPHWDRHNHVAPDLGAFVPPMKYNNEPRGPGASAGGAQDNPSVLAADYRASIAAGYKGYLFHTASGVFGGRCHVAFGHQGPLHIYDHLNANAIAAALVAVKNGGTGPVEPEEPEEPHVPKPYPGDDFFWHSLGDVLEADYHEAGQTLNAGSSVWFARVIWSHVNEGLEIQQSINAHRNAVGGWRDVLGLPRL